MPLENGSGPLTRNEILLIRELIQTTMDERDKRYEQRFVAQESAIDAALESAERAVAEFKNTLNTRLEGMNQFRAQIEKGEKNYILKDVYEKAHDNLGERIIRLEHAMWMIAGAMVLLSFVVPIVLHFLK